MSVCFTFKERMGVAKNLGLEGTQPQKHTPSPTPLLRCCKQVNLFRGDKQLRDSQLSWLLYHSREKQWSVRHWTTKQSTSFLLSIEASYNFCNSKVSCNDLYRTGNSMRRFITFINLPTPFVLSDLHYIACTSVYGCHCLRLYTVEW
jgi:hypothetical protein